MSAVLNPSADVEVLPALTQVATSLPGGITVIDAATGSITFEHKAGAMLMAEAVAIHDEAVALAPLIDSDAMYGEGADLLKKITDSFKTLDEQRLASTKPLRDKVDEINGDYKPAIDKRKEAAEIMKGGLLGWEQEQDRKRRQAEAEARARAEAERRRAEAEARAARERAEQEAAAARRAAEERAAEETRQADVRAAAMRAEAAELERAGNDARAAQLLAEANDLQGVAENTAQTALFEGERVAAEAVAQGEAEADAMTAVSTMITPATPAINKPKAAGVSTSYKYKANVTDPKAVVTHILANWDTCQHLVFIEQGKLDNLAQNQKDRFNFPGTELVKEPVMSARRR